MMETVGMVHIFQRSLSQSFYEIYILHRCDSKTFSSITAFRMESDITVSKLNVLDMFKRMGTRLRKLKQMSSKLSDGKSIENILNGKVKQNDRLNYKCTMEMQSDKIKHACHICEKLLRQYISIYVQATKNHCTVFVP
ncbi:hypothetical protein TNCV_4714811 [Trichonephila clavipes]|nr:hypothetical protein TNCV_4714811 [Trichonephila clavipes]